MHAFHLAEQSILVKIKFRSSPCGVYFIKNPVVIKVCQSFIIKNDLVRSAQKSMGMCLSMCSNEKSRQAECVNGLHDTDNLSQRRHLLQIHGGSCSVWLL